MEKYTKPCPENETLYAVLYVNFPKPDVQRQPSPPTVSPQFVGHYDFSVFRESSDPVLATREVADYSDRIRGTFDHLEKLAAEGRLLQYRLARGMFDGSK